jgi:hypothetical protein
MGKIKGAIVGALLVALLSPVPPARADDPNPSTSEVDNYANLSISPTARQGFFKSSSTLLNSSTGSFTVEAWVNPSESLTATTGYVFLKQDSVAFNLNNLRPEAALQSGSWATYTSNYYLRTNEWQHLAYVKSGGTLSIYVNGGLIYQVNGLAANVLTSTSVLGIGANSWNGSSNQSTPAANFYAGGIDEVRVWAGARSQSEIQNSMNVKVSSSATNLIGYWDFNGTGSTTTLFDRTASGNDLAINASPTFPDIKTVSNSAGVSTITFPRTYLNAQGGYKIPTGVTSISALVVGGGGGGGFDGGGGGGGGGVYQATSVAVTPGSLYTVQVGGGGPAINGYVGGTFCTGSWSSTVVGCPSGTGSESKFGALSASGGGGGGGIENSGSSDSNSGATTRGGGGGGGAQNSKAGSTTGGAGAFSGGASSDVGGNAAGGGASSIAAGSSTTSTLAGAGATGVTANLNSVIYGSGGGGGSYNNATAVSGGANAGTGGTSSLSATRPAVNRGGGGGGGGVGSGTASSGAAGVVIIRFALSGFATLSFTGTPVYRSATTITATANVASRVTFLANGKRIPGCIKVATNNLVATCSWKPSTRNFVTISAQIVPTDSNYTSSSAIAAPVITANRIGKR